MVSLRWNSCAWLRCALAVASVGPLGGCAFDAPAGRATPEMAAPASDDPYRIRVGDVLDVRFYKTPELNVEDVPVRSDGMISVELVGDVPAAGLTTEELTKQLTLTYSEELLEPRISVIVREFGGQVYVGGEVGGPKALKYSDGLTVLGAIQSAGGFNDKASRQNVVLLRKNGDKYDGYRLYLESAMTGEDYSQNVMLQPDDVVFVPKSRVANLNQVVEQYIKDNMPIPIIPPAF
jgi:protein involved in polysaccharide export with SLBB domain